MAEDPEDPPRPDSPPADPAATTPTAQETIADLQRQLEAATGNTQAAFDTTKAALRAANPHLPEAVFDAPDLESLTANVEAHKATAEHIRAHPATTNVNPGGGGTRTLTVPDKVRGISRIAFALSNPGPGMTE